MKWLITVILTTLLCSCNCCTAKPPVKHQYKRVCITYYWPGSNGQKGNITATGKRAKHLQTCAVDPAIFPYGSQLHIKELDRILVANDTGKWVKQRIAAKRRGQNIPVVDIFVSSKAEANKMIKKYPAFMNVTIK